MKAIVLAAGIGKRLLPLTKDKPKSMVKVNNKPILEHILDALSSKKVTEIIIVVGYKKNQIIDYFGNEYKGVKIKYVHNDDYKITNNIYSLKLGLEHCMHISNEDLFLCEGDVVFDPTILNVVNKNQNKNLVFVGKYDQRMLGTVITFDKQTKIIKELIINSKQGESFDFSDTYKTINVYYLKNEFLKNYFLPTLDLYLKNHTMTGYYEFIIGVLLYMGNKELYAQVIDNSRWYEIDDENDLEIAEFIFSENKHKLIKKIYGGYWNYDFLDFCYLFNHYFPNHIFYKELSEKLPQLVNNYPSGHSKLCRTLAGWYQSDGFVKENLIIGNGASEFIRIINKELVKKITIPIPTFNEYENKLNNNQINYFVLPAKNNFDLVKQDFIDSVKNSNSNMALIINPNNPTGRINDKEDIIWILKRLKNVLLIVDESFIDFAGNRNKYSAQDLVDKFSNLIIVRSLSKEFGIPGLRLGYLLTSNNKVKKKIMERLPIWNINSLGEFFIENFNKYKKSYEESIEKVIEDREELGNELAKIKYLKVIPSNANFFICKVIGKSSEELTKNLLEKYKILIKNCSNKKPIENDNYIRISVKTREHNKKLIEALKKIEQD